VQTVGKQGANGKEERSIVCVRAKQCLGWSVKKQVEKQAIKGGPCVRKWCAIVQNSEREREWQNNDENAVVTKSKREIEQ